MSHLFQRTLREIISPECHFKMTFTVSRFYCPLSLDLLFGAII